jgi:hypothetical protein
MRTCGTRRHRSDAHGYGRVALPRFVRSLAFSPGYIGRPPAPESLRSASRSGRWHRRRDLRARQSTDPVLEERIGVSSHAIESAAIHYIRFASRANPERL